MKPRETTTTSWPLLPSNDSRLTVINLDESVRICMLLKNQKPSGKRRGCMRSIRVGEEQVKQQSLSGIDKIYSVIHMCQWIKITEANLHRIPAWKIFAHSYTLFFLSRVLLVLNSNRTSCFNTIAKAQSSPQRLLSKERSVYKVTSACSLYENDQCQKQGNL
jgi:hypothetical protein